MNHTFIINFDRLEVFSFIILAMSYRFALKDFFLYKTYYLINHNYGGDFLAFFSSAIVGLFNLMLESRLLASLYWILLGFILLAMHAHQFAPL
jgi:hypothetical protein